MRLACAYLIAGFIFGGIAIYGIIISLKKSREFDKGMKEFDKRMKEFDEKFKFNHEKREY
jgi:uncharacterized membrane protein (DUF106 family)